MVASSNIIDYHGAGTFRRQGQYPQFLPVIKRHLQEWELPEFQENFDRSDTLNEKYERQMRKLSQNLEKWYGKSNAALQEIAVGKYYSGFDNCVILDVGNGGLSADEQLGPELAARVARFIGIDKSTDMIHRRGVHEKIICDGALMPLLDDSVDYCLLNNVIHHVGVRRTESLGVAAGHLIKECLRVARRGVVIVEMTIPGWARRLEDCVVALRGGMATFVFDSETLRRILDQTGAKVVKDYRGYQLSDLVGDKTWFRPIISLPINVPAKLIPYTYLFCEISK